MKSIFSLRRRNRRRLPVWILLLLPLIALATLSNGLLERQLRIAAADAAETALGLTVRETAGEISGEQSALYGALVCISRDQSGAITAIETDAAAVATLSAAFAERLAERLPAEGTLSVPLGNLLRSDYLNGRGPQLRFRTVLSSAALADVVGSFESAGINQTVHRLSLSVRARITVFLPGGELTRDYTFSCPLTETVIVGKVPSVYLRGES